VTGATPTDRLPAADHRGAPTAHLILVKHSLPETVVDVPACEWRLNDEGRRRCRPLVDRLRSYAPVGVISSVEPKAWETATIIAQRLRLPCQAAADLHEHDRSGVPWLGAGAFASAVEAFFERPDELVFGRETATRTAARFTAAVEGILAGRVGETLVVVAHGTVIALFVAHHVGVDAFALWRRLGLPSFVALALPDHRIVEVVEAIE
jgi:broad specificity phosphatase PhoE